MPRSFVISTHALREEGDYPRSPRGERQKRFLPTPSARRATAVITSKKSSGTISTHALREEGDAKALMRAARERKLFLPTPSARRATWLREYRSWERYHFYPRPPRGGRRAPAIQGGQPLDISTHALREEGDMYLTFSKKPLKSISTHALREEGDQERAAGGGALRNFYPRPPRGGRPSACSCVMRTSRFLPTPSARRATRRIVPAVCHLGISTHALREEGDSRRGNNEHHHQHFYPRPPRGGRPADVTSKTTYEQFLPTPSARRATRDTAKQLGVSQFLPTPSARRATVQCISLGSGLCYFYPRPPRGGRRYVQPMVKTAPKISTHALREEGDFGAVIPGLAHQISTHALREEGDGDAWDTGYNFGKFLPTPSARRATVQFRDELNVV